jgi:hypothetical protein
MVLFTTVPAAPPHKLVGAETVGEAGVGQSGHLVPPAPLQADVLVANLVVPFWHVLKVLSFLQERTATNSLHLSSHQ